MGSKVDGKLDGNAVSPSRLGVAEITGESDGDCGIDGDMDGLRLVSVGDSLSKPALLVGLRLVSVGG